MCVTQECVLHRSVLHTPETSLPIITTLTIFSLFHFSYTAAVFHPAHGNSATRQNPHQRLAPFLYARIACPSGLRQAQGWLRISAASCSGFSSRASEVQQYVHLLLLSCRRKYKHSERERASKDKRRTEKHRR
jgi:hypothetical protein